jgi:hypothetical protein
MEKVRAERAPGESAQIGGTIADLEKTWAELAPAIRQEWMEVLNKAGTESDENLLLFDDQASRIIHNQLARKLHEPKLPFGGKREWELSNICFRLGRDTSFEMYGAGQIFRGSVHGGAGRVLHPRTAEDERKGKGAEWRTPGKRKRGGRWQRGIGTGTPFTRSCCWVARN